MKLERRLGTILKGRQFLDRVTLNLAIDVLSSTVFISFIVL